ncbi:NUDIX domain-containing protein [Erythrobacter dokdonensis]|uniref:MutT/nudix family protein n=1 Tax=Erythrobacter dokdonensis DSW-74 TaxID=1300349 RepID=A0A1A7BIT8_9SPHN|nr:NUDIX domain-containing protein [Erythrobacter dokdonensis]OBV11626.1 MutT/nudix family protein [Erythrobacter dokdonensis DSW-74]
MTRFLPAPLHRALLPLAHLVRHHWRRWRKTPIAGVSVVITNLGGDVLLLKHSYGPEVWGLPGGGLAAGEDPETAARREVREELGIELARIIVVTTLEEELSGSPHTAYLFAATCDQRPRPDGREVVEARFFPSHSLPEPLGETTRARIDAWRRRRNA